MPRFIVLRASLGNAVPAKTPVMMFARRIDVYEVKYCIQLAAARQLVCIA